MNCPNCNSKISATDKFCKNCGKEIILKKDSSEIFGYQCPLCHTPNPITVNYCVKCGHWLLDTSYEAKPITKREYKKYFSNLESESSKSRKIINLLLLVISILIYFMGSPDVKMVLSFLIIILGIISIIKPLRTLGIKSRPRGAVTILAGIVILFISATYLPSSKSAIAPTSPIDLNQYKSESILLSYDDLARQTEKYKGNKVKYTGQVVQVQEVADNNAILRVNVTKDEFNIYKDTIWVNYKYSSGEKRILENDLISFSGDVKGRKSYKTVLGNEITLPEIDGRIIEVIGQK